MDTPLLPTVLKARRTRAPYPLLALLRRSALLRADIRGGHPGTVLHLHLQLLDAGCGAPIADAAVYLHQQSPVALRGVQLSDASGHVHLRTLRPAPGADGRACLELQVCLNEAGQVRAIANTRLCLPGARRGDPPPPRAPVREAPGFLLLPPAAGSASAGQSVALAIALACHDEDSTSTSAEDHDARP